MLKNLTGGSVINYGATLPADGTSFDGALFYKTSGSDQGLYIFGFTQDANVATPGDQSVQGWTLVQNPSLYVSKSGDVITGPLAVVGPNAYNDPYGRMAVTMPNDTNSYGYYGMTRQGRIGWSMGIDQSDRVFFGSGGSGTASNVVNRVMTLDSAGVMTLNGNAVWHAGNDGVGSSLDAGLLAGQAPSFYSNADNISAGTLNLARLPYVPVKQTGTSNISLSWATSALSLQVDATNFGTTWPISISGSAATANFANSSSSAISATEATSTRYVHSGGVQSGTAMTFSWSGQNGTPPWLWGGSDGINNYVYSPAQLSVGTAVNATNATNAVNATTASNLLNFSVTGRSTADLNSYRTSGTFALESTPANAPGTYLSGLVASNADVGLQIVGGYNSDSLFFRGWASSGATFTPWRGIIHTGNIASQSVNYANTAGTAASATNANYATSAGSASSANTANTATTATNATNANYATNAGTASTIAANPTISGTMNVGRIIVPGGSAGAPGFSFLESGNDTGFFSQSDGYIGFASNGEGVGSIAPGGNLVMQGNVSAYSDRRIKKNIEPITDALAKVELLNGITYNRIDNNERGTGLIAQDVQAVLPEAVQEQSFDGMLSVSYGNLVGLLVESIKELNLKVSALQAEVQTLKGGGQ